MSLPSIILCHRRGLWTAAAARLLGSSATIRRVSSLQECDAELASAPRSLVAIAVAADRFAAVVEWLERQPRTWPLACPVCLLENELAWLEWPLREAGAVHVGVSPRGLAGLDVVARNHLARLPKSSVRWSDRVWESIPWKDARAV